MNPTTVPYLQIFYYVLPIVIVAVIAWLLSRKAVPALGNFFFVIAALLVLALFLTPIIAFFFQIAHGLLGKYQPFIYFWALALFVLFSAFQVATRKNLVHAALFLCMTFIGVAGIFILLNAEFIAAVQILIYAGAITVLILFAIMLTQNLAGQELVSHNRQVPFVALATIGLAVLMVVIFLHPVKISESEIYGPSQKWAVQAPLNEMAVDVPNIQLIGQSLMSTYTLAFWIASIILTIAMIGGLILARKE